MMREPLLVSNPDYGEVTLDTLVAIASEIERESVERYAVLEQAMRRRGETATADAFATMRREEESHVDSVRRWTAALGKTVPSVGEFHWHLPPELSQSWQEVIGSAHLTPYRAFAIAVVNEQRAFALYSYLAAQAANPEVARHAERLAMEELRHAALMRRWRRAAWHAERPQAVPAPEVMTEAQFAAAAAEHKRHIDARLTAVADALRAAGDEENARLLIGLRWAPPAAGSPAVPDASFSVDGVTGSAPLLNAAQEPLETFSELLEGVMRVNNGAVFTAAQTALTEVVHRIAQIALEIERRSAKR
jgi:rubrerythrin